MPETKADAALIEQLRREIIAEVREELGLTGRRPLRSRIHRRSRMRSVLAVGLLLAFATAGGIGYASVAATPVPGTQPSGSYQGLTPVRILDTLNGTGVAKAPVTANDFVSLPVAGVAGVPSDATAVVINVTVAQATMQGSLTVYPDGSTLPYASNVNFLAGQTIPNLVVASIGSDGKVDFYNRSSGTVQVIADLAGYYAPGATHTLVVPSDGTAAQNGTALADALNALYISDSTTDVPTTVQLEAGAYSYPDQIIVPPETQVVGAGRSVTTVTVSGTDTGRALDFIGPGTGSGISDLTLNSSTANEAIETHLPVAVDNLNIQFPGSEYAIYDQSAGVSVLDTTITATGAQGSGIVLASSVSTIEVQGSDITSVGNEGVYLYGGTAVVRNSFVDDTAVDADAIALQGGTLLVADSEIVGPATNSGGTLSCVGDYNAAFVALGTACV